MKHHVSHFLKARPVTPSPDTTSPKQVDPVSAASATRTFTQQIKASPDRVFPLLCPVREVEWLDGWAYEMLRSRTGYAEEGCVFRTTSHGEPETIWIVTRREPDAGRVEFACVTPGLVATRLCVRVQAAGEGESSVHVTYELNPTSREGERLVAERHSEEAFLKVMRWWESSMNHFLETGTVLRSAGS